MDRSRTPSSPIKSSTLSTAPATNSATNASTGTSMGTATATGEDLWSSILNSVSNSRTVSTKNCIVLGSSNSGKSTLVSRLSTTTGEALPNASTSSQHRPTTTTTTKDDPSSSTRIKPDNSIDLDLGLSYSVLNIHDEADEETIARLGVYQLPSHEQPYPSLLSLVLSEKTLLDSIVVIVLDWEKPWTFLSELKNWLRVVDKIIGKSRGEGESSEQVTGKERLEAHLRHYVEPTTTSSMTTSSTSAQIIDTDSSLPPGVLTHNLGIPLVIVCTKSDQIDLLERETEFHEEQFDYIQQSLRTIALKSGAALFYTSHTRPTSFSKLRAYILHRLFSPSPVGTNGSESISNQPSSRAFPFSQRANVVDRDEVLVPSGWDSWGKIKVLRDRFDPESLGNAWDDEIHERKEDGNVENVRGGAIAIYEDVVVDLDKENQPTQMNLNKIEALDEQEFLRSHYETLQADREKDPRSAFAARPSSSSSGLNAIENGGYGASIVGPMSSSGLNLPSVERALGGGVASGGSGVEIDDVSARLAKMTRKESNQGPNSLRSSAPSTSNNSLPPSTPSSTATTAAGGQNEQLAAFFSSLLAARSSPSPAAASGGVATNGTSGAGLGTSSRGTGAPR